MKKIILMLLLINIFICEAQDTINNQKNNETQSQERKNNLLQQSMKGRFVSIPEQKPKAVFPSSKEEMLNPKRLKGPDQYDSRIEIAQLKPEINWQKSIYAISESVAMVVEKENLTKISPNRYLLNATVTLGARYNLCEGEAFANQVVIGAGTAFIIDKNAMITAAHVFQRPLKDYAIVFGYRVINNLGTAETGIAVEDVYFPTEIQKNYADLDLVKFITDREIKRPVLQWEKSYSLKNGIEIYMLGYPMGLPEKLAINADITDNSNHQYFYTSLDSFQGNSGSPVFNYETHKIIGVLVSGMIDYELHGDCYKTTLCRQPDCVGEKVVRIELAFSEQ